MIWGLLAVVCAGLFSANLLAWGPGSRPTFTMEVPADYITFNSITNNPKYGDERNFVRIREASGGNFIDEVDVKAGGEYTVQIFYHNDAAKNLNLVATNTRVSAMLPSEMKAGSQHKIVGKVSADNAKPVTVWDEALLNVKEDVKLSFVANSAVIYSNGAVNGKTLANSIVEQAGAPIGYNALDGKLQGCAQFSGYVLFKVKAESTKPKNPDFKIEKFVRPVGGNKDSWTKDLAIKNGDEVEYRIIYTNIGETTQTDVLIEDVLPQGVTLIPGTVELANKNTGGKYGKVSDDIIKKNGINIGSYAPNANAYIKFRAKVNVKGVKCEVTYNLVNEAHAITRDGSKKDSAKVKFTADKCEKPQPEPVCKVSCDLLKIEKINDNEFKFITQYSKENAEVLSVTYVVRNAKGEEIAKKVVKQADFSYTYKQTEAGTYTVEAIIQAKMNNETKDVTSENCKKDFVVAAKEQPVVPTPEAPKELPKTGMAEALNAVFGLGTITSSIGYYVASRKELN